MGSNVSVCVYVDVGRALCFGKQKSFSPMGLAGCLRTTVIIMQTCQIFMQILVGDKKNQLCSSKDVVGRLC